MANEQPWLNVEPAKTTIDGVPYELHPAVIESTSLGYEYHGIFTYILNVSYGGSAQGIGQMCMDEPAGERYSGERRGTAYGHDLIIRTLSVVGVDAWEQLKGKSLYAIKDDRGHYYVAGIASWPTPTRYLLFKEHAAQFADQSEKSD